jgi:hypothetical protein
MTENGKRSGVLHYSLFIIHYSLFIPIPPSLCGFEKRACRGVDNYLVFARILRKNEVLVTNVPLGRSDNRESGEELVNNSIPGRSSPL